MAGGLASRCRMGRAAAAGIGGRRRAQGADRFIRTTAVTSVVTEGITPGTAADIEEDAAGICLFVCLMSGCFCFCFVVVVHFHFRFFDDEMPYNC